jgi:hypothetical protein
MKKIISIIITLHASLFTLHFSSAQDFEVRTFQNDMDYLVIQIRETSGLGLPTTSSDITDLQFEVRWPQSYGTDLDVDLICNTWELVEGLGGRQSEGNYYWRVFAAENIPFAPASSWVQNQWETIGMFKVIATSGGGSGTFEIPPDAWVLQGLNVGIDGTDYTPVVNSNVTGLPYPSLVYDYVWKGGTTQSPDYDENSWTLGTNWEDPCGTENAPSNVPSTGYNCYIPAGLTFYPSNFNVSNSGTCDRLKIQSGGNLTVPNEAVLTTEKVSLENTSDLTIETGGTVQVQD